MSNTENEPQNSFLRKIAGYPLEKAISLLHETFPKLTPNQITFLGTAGLAGLALYVAELEKNKQLDKKTSTKLVSFFLLLSAMDALDGSLARHLIKKGVPHDSDLGQIVDSSFDRVNESLFALLSMFRAAEQEDKLWLVAATIAAFANPLSSLARANAERQGIVVPESGTNLFEFFGTRMGRFVTSTLKVLPTIKLGDVSVQALVDLVTAAATIKTAYERFMETKKGSRGSGRSTSELIITDSRDKELVVENPPSEKMMENANKRFKYILGITLATNGVAIFALLKFLRRGK